MRRLTLIYTLVVCGLLTLSTRAKDEDNILRQKGELEQIKRDVEESQKRLDSLRQAESSLQSQVADFDERISSDRKVINRLNSELSQLKNELGKTETALAENRQAYERIQRRYLGSIRQFYYATRPDPRWLGAAPNSELEAKRQVVYLTALASFESGNVTQAEEYLASSVDQLSDLAGQEKMVTSLKKKREVSFSLGKSQKKKEQRRLDQVKRQKQEESDRMLTLRQAAEEMEQIIARLQEDQARRNLTPEVGGQSAFVALKGRLVKPYSGKVITPFGPSVDPITNLKSYSPGIVIKGKANGTVRLVASGTVAYSGNLRGYGNFVIINHDNEYYTTYAGLGETRVVDGQYLQAGETLGVASADGEVRFELRQGRKPLDPAEWIRIESL